MLNACVSEGEAGQPVSASDPLELFRRRLWRSDASKLAPRSAPIAALEASVRHANAREDLPFTATKFVTAIK